MSTLLPPSLLRAWGAYRYWDAVYRSVPETRLSETARDHAMARGRYFHTRLEYLGAGVLTPDGIDSITQGAYQP